MTTDTEAAVTGITDEQLAVLQSGGWSDDGTDSPGWKRVTEVDDGGWVDQLIFPSVFAGWNADSDGEDDIWRGSLDEALAWCDERAGGAKPAAPGSATKQEDRFARLADRRG